MTLGEGAKIKTIFHRQERILVQDYLNCFKTELKGVPEMKEDFTPNPRHIQLKAQIQFAEKLLGKR